MPGNLLTDNILRMFGLLFTGLLGAFMFAMPMASIAAPYSSYDKIHVAAVRIDETLENRRSRGIGRPRLREDRAVREDDLSDKSADFHKTIVAALENNFEIVDAPASGILTIQPVIIELRSSRPTSADFARQPGLSARSEYAGGAKIVFEFFEDGEALNTFETSYFGDIERQRRKVGIWEDADRAFRVISRRLVKHLGS